VGPRGTPVCPNLAYWTHFMAASKTKGSPSSARPPPSAGSSSGPNEPSISHTALESSTERSLALVQVVSRTAAGLAPLGSTASSPALYPPCLLSRFRPTALVLTTRMRSLVPTSFVRG
jgi:hypothetical protein